MLWISEDIHQNIGGVQQILWGNYIIHWYICNLLIYLTYPIYDLQSYNCIEITIIYSVNSKCSLKAVFKSHIFQASWAKDILPILS